MKSHLCPKGFYSYRTILHKSVESHLCPKGFYIYRAILHKSVNSHLCPKGLYSYRTILHKNAKPHLCPRGSRRSTVIKHRPDRELANSSDTLSCAELFVKLKNCPERYFLFKGAFHCMFRP
jgi:hypothetical protein